MAKLTLAILALVAALVVADATIVRTTVTTTEVEEDNPYHGGSTTQQCPARMLQGKQFNKCRNYLRKSSRPYDEGILRVVDVNPFQQERELLQECCDELKQLQIPQCSCEALKKVIREQQGGRFQGQEEQMRPLLEKARSIPAQCGIPVTSCRFQEY